EGASESISESGRMVQRDTSITTLKFTAEEATEWTALLKRSSGWFGGDGIFAIPLHGVDSAGAGADTTTMLLFSDTLLGEIENNSVNDSSYVMINNSVALVQGIEPKEEN